MMSPTSRCGRPPFNWASRSAGCDSWPAVGRARPLNNQRSIATATAPGRSCTSRQMTGNGEPTGTALRTFKPRVDDGTADRAVFE